MKIIITSIFMVSILFISEQTMAARKQEYLETFELKDLRVIAIETSPCQLVWIKTPDDYFHLAKIGMFIGKNYGKIMEITKDGVVIKEFYQKGKNDWEEKQVKVRVESSE